MHGLIMVFGAIMPVSVCGLCKLDDSTANWCVRHGVCPHEQLQLLADGASRPDSGGIILHARRCPRRWLDAVCAADPCKWAHRWMRAFFAMHINFAYAYAAHHGSTADAMRAALATLPEPAPAPVVLPEVTDDDARSITPPSTW